MGSALMDCVVRLVMYDESKNLGSVSRTSCPWRFGTWVLSQGICDNEIWNLGSVSQCMTRLRTRVLSRILRALGDLELGFRLRVYVTTRFGTWVPSHDV